MPSCVNIWLAFIILVCSNFKSTRYNIADSIIHFFLLFIPIIAPYFTETMISNCPTFFFPPIMQSRIVDLAIFISKLISHFQTIALPLIWLIINKATSLFFSCFLHCKINVSLSIKLLRRKSAIL